MGMSSTERTNLQRARERQHAAGDHSSCLPTKCEHAPDAIPNVTAIYDGGTGTRGEQLIRKLRAERRFTASEDTLAITAGAIVDRIEILRAALEGRPSGWLRAAIDRVTCGHDITVRVDAVLIELRNQEMTLARVLGELRQQSISAARAQADAPREPTGPTPGDAFGGADVTDLFGPG